MSTLLKILFLTITTSFLVACAPNTKDLPLVGSITGPSDVELKQEQRIKYIQGLLEDLEKGKACFKEFRLKNLNLYLKEEAMGIVDVDDIKPHHLEIRNVIPPSMSNQILSTYNLAKETCQDPITEKLSSNPHMKNLISKFLSGEEGLLDKLLNQKITIGQYNTEVLRFVEKMKKSGKDNFNAAVLLDENK